MRALVTGATGFIGGALAQRLVDLGWEVRLLRRRSGKSLPAGLQGSRVFFYEFGKDRAADLQAAVDGCDVVFHAAAIRNRWGESSKAYEAVNVAGTSDLLRASLGRATRFVYVSSVGVVGYPGVLNIDESHPVATGAAAGDYHQSKIAAEQVLQEHLREIDTVIVRPTITYGPGDETGMITRLIELMSKRRFIQIGSGRNHVHLTYIDDLTQGLFLAGSHPAAVGQTFILAGSQPVRIDLLLDRIASLLRMKLLPVHVPAVIARIAGACLEKLYRSGSRLSIVDPEAAPPITRQMVNTFCANRSFSHQKASELIGYRPKTELEDGLSYTIDWLSAARPVTDIPDSR
jgi:nucleoside-diphosphate-sugar epimerase